MYYVAIFKKRFLITNMHIGHIVFGNTRYTHTHNDHEDDEDEDDNSMNHANMMSINMKGKRETKKNTLTQW